MKQSIIGYIQKFRPDIDISLVERAYDFSEKAHQGQKRVGGQDFVTHPSEVAKILLGLNADTATVCAGLLHDTVEDTYVTIPDIEANFGKEVAYLVDAVTKIESAEHHDHNMRLTEEKLMKAGRKDKRVFILKIADVFHNMQTIGVLSEERQKRYVDRCLNFYVRLAHEIGLYELEEKMREMCLRHASS